MPITGCTTAIIANPVIPIDTVLVKLASRCNLNCDYCYVYQMGDESWRSQPKRMTSATLDRLATALRRLVKRQASPLSVVFHGGEPLLIGLAAFEHACSTIRSAIGATSGLHLQTNGTLLTKAIIDVCARHDVGISISMDGPAEVHDRHRPDHAKQGSHAKVLQALKRLHAHPKGSELLTGLLAVIDLQSDPAEVYSFFKKAGAPSVDFLYRDGNHDTLPPGKSRVDSIEYGAWMKRLLDIYLADPSPIRIRVLDDMLKLLLGGVARKEGLGSESYGILVVDTDGTIAKNDTLKSASSADRFDKSWTLADLDALLSSDSFVAYHEAQRPTSVICRACPDLAICGGGMPAHRWSAAKSFDNPSVFCADQRHLIEAMRLYLGERMVA